jgi:hypothetical protein
LSEGLRSTKPSGLESVHDQWLAALRSWNPTLEGEEAALEQFATQMREWQRPVLVPTRSPFRLCFQLEEPREEDGEAPEAQREESHPARRWRAFTGRFDGFSVAGGAGQRATFL